MSTTLTTASRPLAVLHIPPTKVPDFIAFTQGIVTAMTGNASFPSPTPTLATLAAALSSLTVAETAAATRARGAVAVRDEKRETLVMLVEELRAYVQSIADANPTTGAAIIEGAGMALRKRPTRAPRVFSAVQGPFPGTAKLVAPSAARRASYEWEYSPDGGKTWIPTPSTLQAKTVVTGLTPLTLTEFRFRAVTKPGVGNWSQVVSFTVL